MVEHLPNLEGMVHMLHSVNRTVAGIRMAHRLLHSLIQLLPSMSPGHNVALQDELPATEVYGHRGSHGQGRQCTLLILCTLLASTFR